MLVIVKCLTSFCIIQVCCDLQTDGAINLRHVNSDVIINLPTEDSISQFVNPDFSYNR